MTLILTDSQIMTLYTAVGSMGRDLDAQKADWWADEVTRDLWQQHHRNLAAILKAIMPAVERIGQSR